MQINGEDVYLYSPFDVKRWTDEEIAKETAVLIKRYNPDADTMYQLAMNIETLANINYLYGEMIARLDFEYGVLKEQVKQKEDKAVYTLRNDWHTDKVPNIDYFKARASELVERERTQCLEKLEMLNRFKYAYRVYEEKINAVKKKMESIKYEEFGGLNG